MWPIREHAARLGWKNRSRTLPLAESLDDRVVPAVVGAGHGGFGGFAVEAAVQRQNPYVFRLQEMRRQLQARREARIEQVMAFRQDRLAHINAVLHRNAASFRSGNPAEHPYLQALRARRMVSSGALTPSGPLAHASNPLGPNATSPFHPTSPNDFPFGPGGFFAIRRTPDGFAGLSSVRPSTAAFSGGSATSTTLPSAPNFSTSLVTTTPSASTDTSSSVETGTSTGPNSTTILPNPTSPNDFPFGPGGFFTVTTAPDGSIVGLI